MLKLFLPRLKNCFQRYCKIPKDFETVPKKGTVSCFILSFGCSIYGAVKISPNLFSAGKRRLVLLASKEKCLANTIIHLKIE